jgi:hypothetical protein
MEGDLVFRTPILCSMLDSGAITSVKFSHLGERLGVATSIGTLFIFETGATEPIIEFPPVDGPINSISPF